jgi:hypothetical protein
MLRKMLTFEAAGYRSSSAARHEAAEGPPVEEEGTLPTGETPRPSQWPSVPDTAPVGVAARADGRVAPVQSPAVARAGVAPPSSVAAQERGADRQPGSSEGARPPADDYADAPASDE